MVRGWISANPCPSNPEVCRPMSQPAGMMTNCLPPSMHKLLFPLSGETVRQMAGRSAQLIASMMPSRKQGSHFTLLTKCLSACLRSLVFSSLVHSVIGFGETFRY